MIRTPALVALVGLAAPALAEPRVVYLPGTNQVRLTDFDPNAPDIRLSFFHTDAGGGSNGGFVMPWIVGTGWSAPGGAGLLVESVGPLLQGDEISGATPGNWGVADIDVYYGAAPDNYPLGALAYENFPFQSDCLQCPYVVDGFFPLPEPGIKYYGLRWEEAGETYYGWVALEVVLGYYGDPCRIDDPFACPDGTWDDLWRLELRFVQAGYETEPNTPIAAGADAPCRADLNFDGRLDFFDLSEFIRLYNAGHPAADFFLGPFGDGLFNFHDVASFVMHYNAGCEG